MKDEKTKKKDSVIKFSKTNKAKGNNTPKIAKSSTAKTKNSEQMNKLLRSIDQ